jgi:acetyl-CoA carboxylase / biotin carboxylase 1
VGYVGAATVEFLYVLEENRYFFLELNPRLQVEHPVTEWITGVNIPACQIMVGMGIPLSAIPDIRALFDRTNDTSPIDFSTALRVRPFQLFFC